MTQLICVLFVIMDFLVMILINAKHCMGLSVLLMMIVLLTWHVKQLVGKIFVCIRKIQNVQMINRFVRVFRSVFLMV